MDCSCWIHSFALCHDNKCNTIVCVICHTFICKMNHWMGCVFVYAFYSSCYHMAVHLCSFLKTGEETVRKQCQLLFWQWWNNGILHIFTSFQGHMRSYWSCSLSSNFQSAQSPFWVLPYTGHFHNKISKWSVEHLLYFAQLT